MPVFRDRVDVWRMKGTYEQGKQMTLTFRSVPATRVPASRFDALASAQSGQMTATQAGVFPAEASEATDIFQVPYLYLQLIRYDDEVRWGRFVNTAGVTVPRRFTVRGVQDFGGGLADFLAIYVRELR